MQACVNTKIMHDTLSSPIVRTALDQSHENFAVVTRKQMWL